jgi:cytochrome c553
VAKKFSVSLLSLLAVAAISTTAVAEDDVLSRIKPVGQVNVSGAAAAPAAASAAPAAAAATPAAPAAAADPGAAAYQAKGCGGCHGADGKTTPMGTYPKIAGQSAVYLLAQMKDIKSGTRANGQTAMMKPIIAGVSDDEMKAIAEWLSKQ